MAGRDPESPCRAFVDHRSVELAHRGDGHRAAIALGLDHRLASDQRIGIEDDRVHALIAAGTGHLTSPPRLWNICSKRCADKHLEVLPLHHHQVLACLQSIENVGCFDEPSVLGVELAERPNGLQADHFEPDRPLSDLKQASGSTRLRSIAWNAPRSA